MQKLEMTNEQKMTLRNAFMYHMNYLESLNTAMGMEPDLYMLTMRNKCLENLGLDTDFFD